MSPEEAAQMSVIPWAQTSAYVEEYWYLSYFIPSKILFKKDTFPFQVLLERWPLPPNK